MTTGRTIALTRWTFVGKVMSLLFNMLSRLVIAFLPRNKRFFSSSEKTAPRRQEGKLGYIPVCKEGSRQSENQRSGIRLRNLAFYVWVDATPWAWRIHSFHITSAIWCQSCFLVHLKEWQTVASCIPPTPQQSPPGVAASARSQFGEP